MTTLTTAEYFDRANTAERRRVLQAALAEEQRGRAEKVRQGGARLDGFDRNIARLQRMLDALPAPAGEAERAATA
jgi:hypothetical protein